MTEREKRLRERIDELTDQRDAALACLHHVRAQRDQWRQRFYDARDGRNLWRHRALSKFKRTTTAAPGSSLDGTSARGRKEVSS